MEAKDTVMREGSVIPVPMYGDKIDITAHLQAQAEISFKAGYEVGYKQAQDDAHDAENKDLGH